MKTVKISGKDYVLVSERVKFFNENYKNGMIKTDLISAPHDQEVVTKATVIPDCDKPERYFTGYSQAIKGEGYINKTSALENCETSAVGRALGLMGIGVIDSVASADELKKSTLPAQQFKTPPVSNYAPRKIPNYEPKVLESMKKDLGDSPF